MSKGGDGVTYSPERIFNAWQNYGQTSQFSPFGSLIYTGSGGNRAAHLMLPDWQLKALGQQAGLQNAARSRLLSMFGGSPYDVEAKGPGILEEWANQAWLHRPWEKYGMTEEQWFNQLSEVSGGSASSTTDDGTTTIPFEGGSSSEAANYSDLLEGTIWEGKNWDQLLTKATPGTPDWWTGDDASYSDWYWSRGPGSQGGAGIFQNYEPGYGAFFQHLDTPEMAGWFKDQFGDDANAQDRWRQYYWTKGAGKDDLFSDDYGWRDLLGDYGLSEESSDGGGVHRPDEDRRTSFYDEYSASGGGYAGGGFFENLMAQMGELPELAWEIDWDKIPEIPGIDDFSAERQRVEDAQFRRARNLLDPVYEQREDALRERLANMGLPVGSEISNIEMGNFGRDYGQALENAALSSVMAGGQEHSRMFGLGLAGHQASLADQLQQIGLQNRARSQGLGEMMGVQAQEYNQLMSLLGGQQVPYMGFGNFMGNQLGMGGADPFGMAIGQNQFQQGMASDFQGGMMGMIGSIIAAALM